MDLQPGMRVRCVDASGLFGSLHPGREYTIARKHVSGDLFEMVQKPAHWFIPARFKPIVRVKAPTKRLTNLEYAVERAVAWYRSLSPADKAAHDEAQRQSWARGEAGLDKGEDRTRVVPSHIFANAH